VKTCIVDSSVVAKWFLPEEHSDEARALLTGAVELIAPDLMPIEVASVAWKRVQRGELTAEEATALVHDLVTLPVRIEPSDNLIESALELALVTKRTVYDCLYVALAVAHDCEFVTADERLVNALAATPLGNHARHVAKRQA
jgi:predicted nucleic acid-binding protein